MKLKITFDEETNMTAYSISLILMRANGKQFMTRIRTGLNN